MRRYFAVMAPLAFLLLAGETGAQGTAAQKPADFAPVRIRLGQAGSQLELDSYNRMRKELDPVVKRNLIALFASDYPESGLLAYAYQDGFYLARQADNIEMMAEYAEKSLELWPENHTLLTEAGSVYVQRDRIGQAEIKARQALDLISLAAKPAHMSDKQWTEVRNVLLSSNCNTLGFVHLRNAQANRDPAERKIEAETARSWFVRARQQRPNDDFTFYGLGFACMLLNDYPDAEANLAKAVVLHGIVTANARTLLEAIYKSQHNQSLDGIERVLMKARADLGL